jgi:hypothetical protein
MKKKMSSPQETISWETNNVKRRRLLMGEGETTDEFITQMTIDNIPDEDRGEILVRATSSKLMMPWKEKNLLLKKKARCHKKNKEICVSIVSVLILILYNCIDCRLQMMHMPHIALKVMTSRPNAICALGHG